MITNVLFFYEWTQLMKTTFANTFALFATASALILTACATKPADPTPSDVVGGMKSEDAKSAECVTASIVGGILGSMVADDKNTTKGAAAGAGIGMLGCVVLKANSRKEQTGGKEQTAPAPATAASAAK
jgi:putative effector of murein hydrolase